MMSVVVVKERHGHGHRDVCLRHATQASALALSSLPIIFCRSLNKLISLFENNDSVVPPEIANY